MLIFLFGCSAHHSSTPWLILGKVINLNQDFLRAAVIVTQNDDFIYRASLLTLPSSDHCIVYHHHYHHHPDCYSNSISPRQPSYIHWGRFPLDRSPPPRSTVRDCTRECSNLLSTLERQPWLGNEWKEIILRGKVLLVNTAPRVQSVRSHGRNVYGLFVASWSWSVISIRKAV